MKLDGHISILRNMGDRTVNFEIVDKVSGMTVLIAQMSIENFGAAITGQGAMPADIQMFNNHDRLGKETRPRN
jgi:hypothetical protein